MPAVARSRTQAHKAGDDVIRQGLRLGVDEWTPNAIEGTVLSHWNDLAERCATTFFQSPAWILAWRATFAPTARGSFVTVAESGRMCGVAPLVRLGRPLHKRLPIPLPFVTLAGAGPGSADAVAPLAETADVAAMLSTAIHAWAQRSTVFVESAASEFASTLRTTCNGQRFVSVGTLRAPGVELQPSKPPHAAWSASLRKDTERMERRLSDLGVTGRWIDGRPDAHSEGTEGYSAGVHRMAELHRLRWQLEGRPGLLNGERVKFLSALAHHATASFHPALFELRLGEETIAALLAFRAPRVWTYYQSGWHPEWTRYGLGRVIVAQAIRRAHADGADYFDFLRGPEDYKYRFGAADRIHSNIVLPRGLSGRLLLHREQLIGKRHVKRDTG